MTLAVATAASIQALAEALHANRAPAAASHRLVLSSFWKEDLVGWFHYAEAEFVVSDFPADSYICYSHVLRALPPDVIAAVRDLVCVVTPETPGAYVCLKPAYLPPDATPAQPPLRGWPPADPPRPPILKKSPRPPPTTQASLSCHIFLA